MGKVKLYEWSFGYGNYRLYREYRVSDKDINSAIIKALETAPDYQGYRWECYNSLGEFQGNIYNTDYSTFTHKYLT